MALGNWHKTWVDATRLQDYSPQVGIASLKFLDRLDKVRHGGRAIGPGLRPTLRTGINNHESPSCTATATDGIRAVPSCDIFRLIRSVHGVENTAIASKSSLLAVRRTHIIRRSAALLASWNRPCPQ